MTRRDYVNITKEDLEDWLNTNFGSWSKDSRYKGVYLIHLSNRVAIKMTSGLGERSSAGVARASMKLSLVSLVDNTTLNRIAKDRKHFQRTKNWRKTWKDGVDHWRNVYEAKDEFYEKIADKAGYKSKWIGLIDSIPTSGSNDNLIKSRDTLEGGGVLWSNQENYILAIIRNMKERQQSQSQPQQPLNVEKLRDLYRAARRRGDQDDMRTIVNLGHASNRNEAPSSDDLRTYKSLRLKYAV